MSRQFRKSNITKYLNNGTTTNAVGNYSVTPSVFKWVATSTARIYRLIIGYEDQKNWEPTGYGGGAALTNGITVKTFDSSGNTLNDLTNTEPVTTNYGWASLCYDATLFQYGNTNEAYSVRWSFDRSGEALLLYPGDYFGITLNDDFSGLVAQTFCIQGTFTGAVS